jgi:CheY-like chemotaxis protein
VNGKSISILVVSAELPEAEAIGRGLRAGGPDAELRVAGSLREYRELLAAAPPDLVLIDLLLPDGRAEDALVSAPEAGGFPIVVLVPPGDAGTAVALIQGGAMDCLVKSPEVLATLPICVSRVLREWDLRLAHRHEKNRLEQTQRFGECIATLAAGIAHDLNNALAPILMTIELIRESGGSIQESALETIQTGAQRATGIVRQLVTVSNAPSDNRFLFQPRHLFKEVERHIRAEFPQSIQVTSRCPKDLWLIRADPIQLHEVMLRLSRCARETMPEGGRLTLNATNVELDAAAAGCLEDAKPGRYVCLEARHTGRSILPAVLARISNPAPSTLGPQKTGAGQGLATALGTHRSHGGVLVVGTETDGGSAFRALFPAAPDTNASTPSGLADSQIHGAGRTVLVVDDEPLMRNTVTNILRRLGFHVLSSADGVEALGLCARHLADLQLVLTDLDLPHMSGLALLRTVRQMNRSIAMMAMTGRCSKEQRAELAALDVTLVLRKPFAQKELQEALRRALPGESFPASCLAAGAF